MNDMTPEEYREKNLKGERADALLKKVGALKRRINGLKRKMSSDRGEGDYPEDAPGYRENVTELERTRGYLEETKAALGAAGGVNPPDAAERRGLIFNENAGAIERITFSVSGYYHGCERYVLERQHARRDSFFMPETEDETFPEIPPEETDFFVIIPRLEHMHDDEAFFEICGNAENDECAVVRGLGRELRRQRAGEWKRRYFRRHSTDGVQWELKIEYGNGARPFVSEGSNMYPYNFLGVLQTIGIRRNNGRASVTKGTSETDGHF